MHTPTTGPDQRRAHGDGFRLPETHATCTVDTINVNSHIVQEMPWPCPFNSFHSMDKYQVMQVLRSPIPISQSPSSAATPYRDLLLFRGLISSCSSSLSSLTYSG